MAFIQRLGQLRSPVSTYANLPLTGNVLGDVRLATDTGDAYTWMIEASSGLITNWKKVTSSSYSDLIGAPYSTALAIDNAVKVVTGLSINVALLAFNTLTGYGSALAKMFDGIVNQFMIADSGLEAEDCENNVYVDPYETLSGGYYMPNKSDLDIYTRMLIHGDGVQDSTSFVDLLRQPLISTNAIVDLNIKKFGTGSIKFNGTNSSIAISDADGIIMGKYGKSEFYAEPMCLDFWFYSLASGLQPILANQAYTSTYESYDAGEVISIQRLANGHIYANILVTSDYGMTKTPIEVEGSIVVGNNSWNHIAIQKVNGYLQIWVNGVLDATSVAHVVAESNYYQAIVNFGKLDTAFLNGHLDEIRLSNTERYTTTFTPMTKAYNTATTPAPTPTIVDISSGAKTVTVHGNARMSGTNPLFGNASLYLDGIDSYLSLADSDDWKLSEDLGAGPIDSDTKLLLHLDNNVTDSELTPKTVTNNNVTFSSGKFNQAAYFNGSNAYLSIPPSSDFYITNGDFTIDFWVNFSTINDQNHICSVRGTGTQANNIIISGPGFAIPNTLRFYDSANGIQGADFRATFAPSINTWYHIAVERDGNVCRMFVNGISLSVSTTSPFATTGEPNMPFYIGVDNHDGIYSNILVDEFRVSKGIARWTSNFTPSASAYGSVSLSDYTVDLWIDPLSLSDSNTYIIGQDDAWKLTLDGTSNKYLKFSVIGGNSVIAPISLSLETWQHVAIVQSSGTIKMYVNGILGASISGSAIINGTNPLTIGADSTGAHLFNGFIEEVRISKGIARWTSAFTTPEVPYDSDSYTKLLLPLNVQTVPNMILQSVGYVSNYVPTSARVVIFEEDIDVMEQNVDLKIEVSRDGGTTFSDCLIAKDQQFGDGTLNLFSGSVDLSSQPNGELMVWKLTTQNNKDCRIRGISLNWR